jgi:Polysaccharide biosynthesis protein.
MIFVMLISLYTSRVVLEILGEDDFGIYVLVGGVVSIFTIISGSLNNSVVRFLSIGLGNNDKTKTQSYFTQSLTLFLILIAVFLIIGETFGLWFVLNKLNYPETRSTAVFWVYQFTLFAVLGGIFQIPFSGAVIAREKLNIFAFLSMFDVLAKTSYCCSIA